jgi:hypothetical protein
MALSNAERQKRFRERLRARASSSSPPLLESIDLALQRIEKAFAAAIALDPNAVEQDISPDNYIGHFSKVKAELRDAAILVLDMTDHEDQAYKQAWDEVATSFGLPIDPWPDLTQGDLFSMIKGRAKEGCKRLGVKMIEDRPYPASYSVRMRAEENREWLEVSLRNKKA